MKRYTLPFEILLVFAWDCFAAPDEKLYSIDLSGSRSSEELSASGAPFRELKNVPLTKLYRLEDCFVRWVFPGGTSFQHHIHQSTVEYRDGALRFISSYGEMMPLEEILVVARQLHALLGKPEDKLKEWEAEARAKGYQAKTFTFGARNCNPEIDCEIRHSFGVIYPWILVLRGSWLTAKELKIAEKELKKPPPLPFTGAGVINLDPPSVKRYTPEEERQKYKELYTPKPVSEKGQPPQPPSIIAANTSTTTTESDNRSFLWLWISLAVLVLAGVRLLLKGGKTN